MQFVRFQFRLINWLRLPICLISGFSLVSCASTNPSMTINTTGPVLRNATAGPAKVFLDAEGLSRPAADDPALAKKMFLAGATLIYFNCNEYFDNSGKNQNTLIFTRDSIGVISAAATSIMALAKARSTALVGLGIGTTTAYAGIDLIEKDYLFSADNIDSVRTLTNNALSAHEQAVISLGQQFSYAYAITQLRDEQTICTLRHIASLASDAIKKGQIQATTNTVDNDLKQIAAIQDSIVFNQLGTLLGARRPLIKKEAGDLYWIMKSTPPQSSLASLYSDLAIIPSANSPISSDGKTPPTYSFVNPWAYQPAVINALGQLSDATKTDFDNTIQSQAAPVAAQGAKLGLQNFQVAGKIAGAPTVLPDFSKSTAPPMFGSSHIEVNVK